MAAARVEVTLHSVETTTTATALVDKETPRLEVATTTAATAREVLVAPVASAALQGTTLLEATEAAATPTRTAVVTTTIPMDQATTMIPTDRATPAWDRVLGMIATAALDDRG